MHYYDVLDSSEEEYTLSPFAITNNHHVMNYQIKSLDSAIDFRQEENNFILVPQQYQEDFEKEVTQIDRFESANN